MGKEIQPTTIFLSHASEDRELAAVLQAAINDAFPGAFQVFNAFEPDSIAISEDWRIKLKEAVQEATLLLVLLTPSAITKPWIYWETGGAFHRNIPIIPVIGPGCNDSGLPEQIRHLQAVSIQELKGLQQLFDQLAKQAGMTHLSRLCDLSETMRKIDRASTQYKGKAWSAMTSEALRRYLSSRAQCRLEIRVISYTSETTATSIPREIDEAYDGANPLSLRVLVRSEYHRFALRPDDSAFNQRIRWRISRAKADWYSWARQPTTKATLKIRDYWWDPSAKAMLLGRSEGFLGLYSIKFGLPSGTTAIAPELDWVAAETMMAPLSSTSQKIVDNTVKWFDDIWDQSTVRTNEAHRAEVSELLLHVAEAKQLTEPALGDKIRHWRSDRQSGPDWMIGNLDLPSKFPEEAPVLADFMACAFFRKGLKGAILICEVRKKGQNWEALGKTATYLDSLGIHPRAIHEGQPLRRDSAEELLEALRDESIDVRWATENRDAAVTLFAADFVWAYVREGTLRIVRPEGEVLWGFWDSARYLLRSSLTERGWAAGVQRTAVGRQILQELLAKLPIGPLSESYGRELDTELAAVFVLSPDSSDDFTVNRIRDPDAAIRLLADAICSAPHHPSEFWHRPDPETLKHRASAARICNAIAREHLPPVFRIGHRVPFGSVEKLVRKALDEIIGT